MFSFVLPLGCLEVRLEVRPGFFVALLVVPSIAVVVKQARVVHQRVYCVDDVFFNERPSSIVRELLYLLDTLHRLL